MPLSNAPTPELQRRFPIEPPIIDEGHFRPAWRRCDRLDRLAAQGLINHRERLAAVAFRALYGRAHNGPGGLRAQDWAAVKIDKHCRRPGATMTEHQLAALSRLRGISKSLGSLYLLLEWTVVEEMSWCDISRRLHVERRTAKTWALAAIAALAAL